MRMITSAQIRSKPEEYEPFLTHPDTGGKIEVKEFCESVVEVLGKEAGERPPPLLSFQFRLTVWTDHVQLTAISQALQVNVKIAYLDGRNADGRVDYVTFNHASDEKETPLTLIYR